MPKNMAGSLRGSLKTKQTPLITETPQGLKYSAILPVNASIILSVAGEPEALLPVQVKQSKWRGLTQKSWPQSRKMRQCFRVTNGRRTRSRAGRRISSLAFLTKISLTKSFLSLTMHLLPMPLDSQARKVFLSEFPLALR